MVEPTQRTPADAEPTPGDGDAPIRAQDERAYARAWSRLPSPPPARVVALERHAPELDPGLEGSLLPFGRGRTYGDTCLNPGETVLDTARLDRVLDFDARAGTLRCEAGVTLAAILDRTVPAGWILPVCPGAMRVSVGGALAHDVHGKNQGLAGNFGCHVLAFELLRSSGERLRCSPDEHPELFAATIGGLGLTGLVTRVELRLARIASPFFRTRTVRCTSLEELLARLAEDSEYDHSVAWLDSFTQPVGARSVLVQGCHAKAAPSQPRRRARRHPRIAPGVPAWLFRRATVRLANRAYYHLLHPRKSRLGWQHYETFLFPGESAQPTNRHYGRTGVYAYHCLLPLAEAGDALPELLERTSRPGDQSLSTSLKLFGARPSPGMLSFSGPGLSLVVGFPNEGRRTLELMGELDRVVARVGGKLYPAKDARLPAPMFRSSFPRWQEFAAHVDPRFSSSFWRRVSDG